MPGHPLSHQAVFAEGGWIVTRGEREIVKQVGLSRKHETAQCAEEEFHGLPKC